MSAQAPITSTTAYLTLDGVGCGFAGCRYPGAGSEFELLAGLHLNALVYDWIRAAWAGHQQPRSGEIVPYGAREKIVFTEATIAATRFPTLDSRVAGEAAEVVLELHAHSLAKAVASPVDRSHHPVSVQQHAWLRSNFRLEIGSVDCSRVWEVASFGVASANPSAPPPHLPIIEVRFAPQSLPSWKQWQAAPSSQPARNGAIHFLAADLHTELAHLALTKVTLVRLLATAPARPDQIAPAVAGITAARMQLVGPPPA